MKRITAILLVLVLLVGVLPSSVFAADDQGKWEVSFDANPNTTTATMTIPNYSEIGSDADTVMVDASMYYKDAVVKRVEQTISLSSYSNEGVSIDFDNYGKFSVTISYLLNNEVIHTNDAITVGIYADKYNIAPLNATFPVTFFSLSLWGEDNIREDTPTIVCLTRVGAYDWDNLPSNVYCLPFLQKEDFNSSVISLDSQMVAAYVKDLMEINPSSHINFYCCDIWAPNWIPPVIYANKVNDYSLFLLTDGTATYSQFSRLYNGSDNSEIHNSVVSDWKEAKDYAYENGSTKKLPGSVNKYFWAIVDSEPNAELWVARKALLTTSGDENAFGTAVQNDPKVIQKSIGTMLSQNIASSDTNTAEFKALYNFNDDFFEEAQKQNKDVMMFLGTNLNSESDFKDYASFTMSYYGDDYVYYYKGHPATPTELYPDKQTQLEELGISDVNASIAAELILFFNPDIYLSGYGSSTYQSVPAGHAKGMFNMSKESGMSNDMYKDLGAEFFMTKIGESPTPEIADLIDSAHRNFLVEFGDDVINETGYEIAIYDADTETTTYHSKYNIVVDDDVEDNVVSVDKDTAYNGARVMLTTSLEEGFGVQVIDAEGNAVALVDNTFVMPESDVTVSVDKLATIQITQPTGGEITVEADGKEISDGATVFANSVLNLKCVPDEGYSFKEWTSPAGVTDSSATTTTYTVGNDVTLITIAATLTEIDSGSSDEGGSSSGGGGSSAKTKPVSLPAQTENGKVTSDKANAKPGDIVTITVTPDEGYKADGVKVTDKNGNEVPVTDNGDGTYSFKMPSTGVTVEPVIVKDEDVTPSGIKFVDVPEDAYFASAVDWAVQKGITDGTDDTHFSPDNSCTRAQMVTFLWRAAGQPEPTGGENPFTDVPANEYFTKAVLWAVEKGITDGATDTTFDPNGTVSRAQSVTFLFRYCGERTDATNPFTDVDEGAYYYDAVLWAVAKGVTNGKTDTAFAPYDDCTRGQIVTFLYRAVGQE